MKKKKECINNGLIAQIMGHVNPWSHRQTKYFLYVFFRIGLIIFVGSCASKRLNDMHLVEY